MYGAFMDALYSLPPEDAFVLDIGANLGLYALGAAAAGLVGITLMPLKNLSNKIGHRFVIPWLPILALRTRYICTRLPYHRLHRRQRLPSDYHGIRTHPQRKL